MEWDLGMLGSDHSNLSCGLMDRNWMENQTNQKLVHFYPDNLPATINIGQGSPTNVNVWHRS